MQSKIYCELMFHLSQVQVFYDLDIKVIDWE
jgi:hypothetical protein